MAAVGLFMLVCGTLKSEFIIYRLMVYRSRIVWGHGDAVHRFYVVDAYQERGGGLIVIHMALMQGSGEEHEPRFRTLSNCFNRNVQ